MGRILESMTGLESEEEGSTPFPNVLPQVDGSTSHTEPKQKLKSQEASASQNVLLGARLLA
jgi:hypothetical protein